MTGFQGNKATGSQGSNITDLKVTRLEGHNVTELQGGTLLQSWRVTSYKFERTSKNSQVRSCKLVVTS